jgi:hypothetical protein
MEVNKMNNLKFHVDGVSSLDLSPELIRLYAVIDEAFSYADSKFTKEERDYFYLNLSSDTSLVTPLILSIYKNFYSKLSSLISKNFKEGRAFPYVEYSSSTLGKIDKSFYNRDVHVIKSKAFLSGHRPDFNVTLFVSDLFANRFSTRNFLFVLFYCDKRLSYKIVQNFNTSCDFSRPYTTGTPYFSFLSDIEYPSSYDEDKGSPSRSYVAEEKTYFYRSKIDSLTHALSFEGIDIEKK